MKSFASLVAAILPDISELFPWDVDEMLRGATKPLILDVREPDEFTAMHIAGSLHVPRGIVEAACEYNYEETVSELVEARERDVVVVCRSGNRSGVACEQMAKLGFTDLTNLSGGMIAWAGASLPVQA